MKYDTARNRKRHFHLLVPADLLTWVRARAIKDKTYVNRVIVDAIQFYRHNSYFDPPV